MASRLTRIVLEKKAGETPLETLAAWKAENPRYAQEPASYAGRLDPMAEGLLLVLLGDECKKQAAYTKLDKEYDIEVLLDIASDTGDALGLPSASGEETRPTGSALRQALAGVRGTHFVPYPAYSSKTVAGKPLFLYALEGALGSIERPVHEETIHRIRLRGCGLIAKDALAERIRKFLERVPRSDEPSKALGADFRQDAIRAEWIRLFSSMPERGFAILRIRVTCGSGTYMRTLAERIGKRLGTSALALSIRRTKIGRYRRLGPLGFWSRTYRIRGLRT